MSMGTSVGTATGCTSSKEKGKDKGNVRSSALGGFVRSEMRSIVAFQAGAAAATAFMILMFLSLSYPWSSDGNFFMGPSSPFFRRGQFPQKLDAVAYLREWESPQVREVRADDRASETAYGEVARRFIPFGTGNFLFSLFSAYRTGQQNFTVLGLGPRLMHVAKSKPGFTCFWDSNNDTSSSSLVDANNGRFPQDDKVVIQGTATNHYPQDLRMSQEEYATVVVHCNFEFPVGADGKGGELRIIADHGEDRKDTPLGMQSVEFVALTEDKGAYNATTFDAPFQYEYMYCGGPLYGSLNPHRLREWLAYHMMLLGESSHFVFYDDGGVNDDSWKVLEPWVKLRRLTIMNVKQEARYDSYYHSQYLLTNDCLCRAKPLARWAFFFDTDEYLYITVSPHLELSFHKVMSEMAERGRKATVVQFRQSIMSKDLCAGNDTLLESQWALEELVYKREFKDEELYQFSGVYSPLDDYKSAVQPKYVLVMGVHDAMEVELPEGFATSWNTCSQPNILIEEKGCTYNSTEDALVYYHFHGTTGLYEELCQGSVDPQQAGKPVERNGVLYKFDNSLSLLVDAVKDYELGALHPNATTP